MNPLYNTTGAPDDISPDTGSTFSSIPSYMVAADNHSVANGEDDMTPLLTKIKAGGGAVIGAAVGQAIIPIPVVGAAIGGLVGGFTAASDGKFATAAMLSGMNDFHNTGAAVGNLFGFDAEQRSMEDVMSAHDDDLYQYYKDNSQLVDTAGFIGGSLLPGLGAVKAYSKGAAMLNAAREGVVGAGMSEASGLLIPMQRRYLAAAISDIQSGSSTYNLLNANTLKATLAGFGEQAIQGAVFETAVSATMFKSPIMEDMDAQDVAHNILYGAMFQGAIGGLVEGATIFGKLRAAKNVSEIDTMPYVHRQETVAGSTPSERILTYMDDMYNTPAPDAEMVSKYGDKADRLLKAKLRGIGTDVRMELGTMAGGDTSISNLMADRLFLAPDIHTVSDGYLGMKDVSRIAEPHAAEAQLAAFRQKQAYARSNPGNPKFALTEEEEAAGDAVGISYTKLWGEDAGSLIADRPRFSSLQDTLPKGASITVSGQGIFKEGAVRVGETKFVVDPAKPLDLMAASQNEWEARYLYAYSSAPLKEGSVISMEDLPFMEKALMETAEGARAGVAPKVALDKLKFKHPDGSVTTFADRKELFDAIISTKNIMKYQALTAGDPTLNTFQLAKKLNMRQKFLDGTAGHEADPSMDYLANQSFVKEHNHIQETLGFRPEEGNMKLLHQPQTVRLVHDLTKTADLDGHVLEGMAAIKQKQAMYRQATDRAVGNYFGAGVFKQFMPIGDDVILKATSSGVGAGFLSAANGNYGTAASIFERVGKVVNQTMTHKVNVMTQRLQPLSHAVAADLDRSLELGSIMNVVRGTPEKYVLSEDGTHLILRGLKQQGADMEAAQAAIQSGAKDVKIPEPYVKTDPKAEDTIFIKHKEVQDYLAAHIEVSGERLKHSTAFRNLQGHQDLVDTGTLYAPPPSPKDYPHFAFVKDDRITGTGHMKMIHAATEGDLDKLIAKVDPALTVLKKKDTEAWHKAMGDYEADLSLHENYIDSSLQRRGVSSSYFPVTDPAKQANDLMNWHINKERQLVREAVNLKYFKQFAELRKLGDQYTALATSKYGNMSMLKQAENVVKNPYMNYLKLALDLPLHTDSPMWHTVGSMLDNKVSAVWNNITDTFVKTKSPDELFKVNQAMHQAGIKTAYYDAALDALANHSIPKGVLSNFVQKSNAILASLTIRSDVINAANNTIGAVILTGTEMKSVLSKIAASDAAVGDLKNLAHIMIPGTGQTVLSPTKLFSNSIKNWFDPARRAEYLAKGLTLRHSQEYHAITHELAPMGTETESMLSNKISKAYDSTMRFFDKAELVTGNKFAEEFTRFMAADMMRQITDVGVAHKLLDPKLADSYIQTFVNRAQGNYLASQRPVAFSGPVGQGIGLFQTYQFNLAQQMLRHVADGAGKNASLLLGLQGTVYGMNGLPAFHVLNNHLIGQAAGNTQHEDIYSTTYRAMNKDAADWLIYGVGSNALSLFHPDLKVNLYTRGDINPRQATILPSSLDEIPIVSASTKFFGNLATTAQKVANGGDAWASIVQGIEHNGVSRPLAGLATALEATTNPSHRAFSTTNAGNLSATNDVFSLVQLGRVLGAKPFDESIAADFGFRKTVYEQADSKKRANLSTAIRTAIIGGNHPSQDQIDGFLKDYVAAGGNQKGFNKTMMDIQKHANTAQANLIAQNLKTPYAVHMQNLLGGAQFEDFAGTK